MKTRLALFITLVLAGLLTACNAESSVTPTPHGDPLAPTLEVANPLNPSPTPQNSDLPLACQVTELNVYIDRTSGYCYAYPKRFTFGTQPLFNIPAVQGPAIGSATEPVFATFAVEVSPNDPNQSLDQQVDKFLREFTAVSTESLTRARLTVGGEAAVMVDNVPVQLSWRIIFISHNRQLYRLMYWPVDVPDAKADVDELYQTTLNSFNFLPMKAAAPSNSPVPQPSDTVIPSIETPTALQPSSNGVTAFFGPLSLVLPSGLASGISGSQLPRVDGSNAAWWDLTPGHTQITLDGYVLQSRFHQPRILVYPAQSYAELAPAAFESMHRLNNILGNPGASISAEQLPSVPSFNAQQVFASNIQVVTFQSGRGVRFVTEYAQYPASANNQDLFYQFQGLTSDGAYYIVAILPTTNPMLGESSDPASAIPVGGVAFPNMSDANPDWQGYYNAATTQLNASSPESFAPTLDQLDLLIQSMRINP